MSIEKLVLIVLLFRPLISYINSYLNGIGIVYSIVVIGLIFSYILYRNRILKKDAIFFIIFLIGIMIAILKSNDRIIAITISLRIILAIEILIVFKSKEIIYKLSIVCEKYYKKIIAQITLINVCLLINTFSSKSYMYMYDEKLFKGPTNHTHTLGYILILMTIITLVLMKIKKSKINILNLILIFYYIILSGARVVLITCIVFVIIEFVNLKRIGILMSAIVVIMTIISNNGGFDNQKISRIPIISKMLKTEKENDILSGRSTIWDIDKNYYLESNGISKIIGNGFDFQYIIHKAEYNMSIWSHNDFISILLSMGIIGTVIYVYFMVSNLINIIKIKENHFKGIIIASLIIIIAYFNGVYEYTDFLISIPFIHVYVTKK